MTTILIVEANTPEAVARGQAGAPSFVRTVSALAPDVVFRHINPHAKVAQRQDFDGIKGAVFTGSGEPWAADAPDVAVQRDAMEMAFDAGVPVWGSCNGMNLAAVVLGGAVGQNPHGIEVGLAQGLRFTAAGASHTMMAGRTSGFAVPCIHRDHVVRLPSAAALLAGNAHTEVQAISIADGSVDFWGTQYHPEAGPADIAVYLRSRGIFAHLSDMADDLEAAESDGAAAERLGAGKNDLTFEHRSRELANWLSHIGVL